MMQLKRPLAIFDLETTGIDVSRDRIVSMAYVKILPDGSMDCSGDILINPGIPIPLEASRVHGITDEQVAQCPQFHERAEEIYQMFQDCDLGGFNAERFDLPLLRNEFARCGITDFGEKAHFVDVMTIYHKNEKRDLSSAVRMYLQKNHDGAHGAHDDALATAEILLKQIELYGLPDDVKGLDDYCHEKDPNFVDSQGKLVWKEGVATFNFGSKVRGQSLQDVVETQASYLHWILGTNFSEELKEIIRKALDGDFPVKA